MHDFRAVRVLELGASYLLHLVRFALRLSQSRFLPLTPGFVSHQVVYDRRRGNRFHLRLRNSIDWIIFDQLFLAEDYATERFARHYETKLWYREALDSGKTPLIIDCGGHAGLAAVYFSQTFPEAQIICIEPNPDNYRQAQSNTSGRKVKVLNAAVGSRQGKAKLSDPGLGNVAHRVELASEGEIPVVSISSLLEEYPREEYFPTIAKIDIEGFEDDLFSDNTDWVERFPLLIIELHDWMLIGTANSQNFLKVIAQSGRDFVYHGENVFSFRNPRKPSKRDLKVAPE